MLDRSIPTPARLLVIVVAVAVGLAVLVAPASPADASTPCGNSPEKPWTDGVHAYYRNTAYCPEFGPFATMSEARLQENVLGVWTFRGNPKRTYHSGTTVLGSGTGSYNCNGHGTDDYRTRGGLRNTDDATEYNSSASATLTC